MGVSQRANRSWVSFRSEERISRVEEAAGSGREGCLLLAKSPSSEEVSSGSLEDPRNLPNLLDLNTAGGQIKGNPPPFGSPDILRDHWDPKFLELCDGLLDIGIPDLQGSRCGEHASPTGQLCLQFVWRDSEGLAKCLYKVKDSGVDELSRGLSCLPV